MGQLFLYLLGQFQIILDDQPVDSHLYIKTKAFLAYLVIEKERVHSRETLAGLIWPDKSQEAAFTNLRQAIRQLRDTIPSIDQYLNITSQTIQFNIKNQSIVDVNRFQNMIDQTDKHSHAFRADCARCILLLEGAMDLYRGPVLANFYVKESLEFNDWILFQQQRIERIALASLMDIVEYYLHQGHFDQAQQLALRQVEIDPYREVAHRQYMRSVMASGQRAAAIKHYDRLKDLLENDLGIKPETETDLLYEQILREEQLQFNPSEPLKPNRLFEPGLRDGLRIKPVFVGRKKEMVFLQSHFHDMLKGSGKIIFVAGEAGWGKTALINAFTQHVRISLPDVITAHGKGNAYTGIGDPYLPFRDLLSFLIGDVETRWAAGSISQDLAYRVWKMVPFIAQTIMENGVDLLDTFVPGQTLLQRIIEGFTKENTREPGWVHRLRQLLEQKNIPPLAPTPVSQNNLFEQYTRVLMKIAEKTPLILVLDDMQWMDAGSISLLFHLGKRLNNSRILLIGAYRPLDLRIGPRTYLIENGNSSDLEAESAQLYSHERHPLQNIINELKRDSGDIEITLSQSEEGFTDALIDSEPNDLNRSFRDAFQNRTQGHPLFVVELLHSMVARGELIKDKYGRLIEGERIDWEILPVKVEALIAERLGRLPKRLLNVLKIASIDGEIFTAEIIAQLLGISENEIIKILSDEIGKEHRLVDAEGVRWIQGRQRLCQYRFDHFLFQKYLYTTLDPNERAYWHGKIGFLMENLFQDRIAENAVSLSWHFEKAKNFEKAVYYLNLVGENAARISANQEAITHFTRAINILTALPDRPEKIQQEITLQINLAIAILATKGYADAGIEKALDRAYDLCIQADDAYRSFAILWQLACYRSSTGHFTAGGSMMMSLIETSQRAGDPLLIALGHWGMGWYDLLAGAHLTSKSHLEVMIDIYDPNRHQILAYLFSQDPGVGSHAFLAFDFLALGFPEQAVEHCQIAIELARQIQHPFSLALALTYHILVLGFLGEIQALKIPTEELIDLTQKYGFTYWYTAGLLGQAWVLSGTSQAEKAIHLLKQGLEMMRSQGMQMTKQLNIQLLAECLLQTGKTKEGFELISQTIEAAWQTGELLIISELVRIRGEAQLKIKPAQTTLAEVAFLESIALAKKGGTRFFELKSSLRLARLWEDQKKYDQAYALVSNIYAGFTEGFDRPILHEARIFLYQLERIITR